MFIFSVFALLLGMKIQRTQPAFPAYCQPSDQPALHSPMVGTEFSDSGPHCYWILVELTGDQGQMPAGSQYELSWGVSVHALSVEHRSCPHWDH